MKIRRSLLKETATVETYTGEGAYGPVYADAVTVRCRVDRTRRLVRTAEGREAVSELTLEIHPNDADRFTPESRVSLDGRVSTVITCSRETYRGYPVKGKVTCT